MSKIEICNICKKFDKVIALDDINLTFEKNKIYGLLGRNGAGKTTLLNLISNRIFPTSGDVMLDEQKLSQIDERLSNLYVMGEKNLYPESFRVCEVFKWTKAFYQDFDIDLATKIANNFHLPMSKKVKSLSTGYETILKDIIGLCVNTKFVFFDEPVLGLDASHRDMFYRYLLKCYSNDKSTFVISTHLIDEVANIIEQVIILDEGKIIRNTTCEKLLSEGYTVSGSISNVDAYVKGKNVIGEDILGNMKAAYILSSEKLRTTKADVDISNINLQKLFVELTRKEAAQ